MDACFSRIRVVALLAGATALGAIPAMSEMRMAEVDLALILAVDVSSSMNASEQRAQREGYVSAFRHPDVLRSIETGPRGRIAVAYLEWAGPAYQRVLVPWTVLERPDDAASFADALAALPLVAEAGTSISGGLAFAGGLFATGSIRSDHRVIDISGDGPNNAGPPVAPVRDALVGLGVTINGLAISLPRDDSPDAAEPFGEHYVESYYENCVIGGPAAFVIAIDDAAQFEAGIQRKLVLEIAGLPPRLMYANHRPRSRPTPDCATVGERPGR
jgi:hypothetical protein